MTESQEREVHEQPKKPYTPPQLTIHGNVEQITQGALTGSADGGNQMSVTV
jgi:hypothetical protein